VIIIDTLLLGGLHLNATRLPSDICRPHAPTDIA
jgi:hypothetical protein